MKNDNFDILAINYIRFESVLYLFLYLKFILFHFFEQKFSFIYVLIIYFVDIFSDVIEENMKYLRLRKRISVVQRSDHILLIRIISWHIFQK
jgi:hypothetical protein